MALQFSIQVTGSVNILKIASVRPWKINSARATVCDVHAQCIALGQNLICWCWCPFPIMQITNWSKNLFHSLTNRTTSSAQAGVKPVALFICICLFHYSTARRLLSYKSWKLAQCHLITYLTIRYTNSPGQKPHIPSSQEECKWPCKKEK